MVDEVLALAGAGLAGRCRCPARLAIEDLMALPLERARHRLLAARCWELRDNLTVYDAAYAALAEALQYPWLTADRRLARAPGLPCEVETLAPRA